MRELLEPHQPIRYRAADFLALWRCDESSGALVDVTGGYTASVVSGTVGAAGSLFAAPAGSTGARTFSSSRATATGNAGARGALLSDWTISAWVRVTSLASKQTILAYAGGNVLVSLSIAATTGALVVSWQGASTVTATSTGAVQANTTHHIAVVKDLDPVNASRYRLRFYIDGAPAGTLINLDGASGGTTSPLWSIGTNASGGEAFAGTLDDLAVLKYAASPEMVRDVYARGVSPYDAATVYRSDSYQVQARVIVERPDGVRVNLSEVYGWDLVRAIDVTDDVDAQGASATLKIVRDVYDVNVAPLVAGSAPNVDAGGQLLALNRRVIIETATAPDGTTDGTVLTWSLLFDGFVEGIDWGDDIITLDLFDRVLALQDVWIEPDRSGATPVDRVYGSIAPNVFTAAVEAEMERLIYDNTPASGYVGGSPSLYVPASPGWGLNNVVVTSSNSVAGQLEQWAGEIGWLCRYRWDDYRKTYRLTFYSPDRTKTWTTSNPTFTSSQILTYSRLELRRDDIRNVVEVEYGDAVAQSDNTAQWPRATLLAQDAASIAKYGRRYCRISIGTNQEINDATQAQRLADNVLSDLKEPKAAAEVEMLFRHFVEVGDVVRLTADGQRFDSSQDFAVVGIAHSLSETQRRTRLTLRAAQPAGRWRRWFDVVVSPGRVPAVANTPPPLPTGVTYTPTLGGVRIRWDQPVNAGSRRYLETEIHRSAVAGFTPSQSTLVATVRGKSTAVIEQLPNTAQYVRLIHRDSDGNVGAASAQLGTLSQQLSIAYVPDEWRQAFHVRQTSGQTWTVGSPLYVALANLTTVDVNTYTDAWNTSLQALKVQTKGLYTLSAGVGLSTSNVSLIGVGLIVNGSLSTYASSRVTGTSTAAAVSGTWTVGLDAGDIVQFALLSDVVKGSVTTLPSGTYVSGALLFARP